MLVGFGASGAAGSAIRLEIELPWRTIGLGNKYYSAYDGWARALQLQILPLTGNFTD
jgi:hypothetical protein